ncbi:hypothetical protein LZ554_008202 [Drepanopeziza brunnea f. sp. 'monogermtubi']|nr:hypothetical protein LZ554_008202 [Drepanopeziza brunnea f. sp. 'monogermtubi']
MSCSIVDRPSGSLGRLPAISRAVARSALEPPENEERMRASARSAKTELPYASASRREAPHSAGSEAGESRYFDPVVVLPETTKQPGPRERESSESSGRPQLRRPSQTGSARSGNCPQKTSSEKFEKMPSLCSGDGRLSKTKYEPAQRNMASTTPVNAAAPTTPVVPAAPVATRAPSAHRASVPSKAPVDAPKSPFYKHPDEIIYIKSKDERLQTELLDNNGKVSIRDTAKQAALGNSTAAATSEKPGKACSTDGHQRTPPTKSVTESIFVLSPEDERVLVDHCGASFKDEILLLHKEVLKNPRKTPASIGFIISGPITKLPHHSVFPQEVGRIFENRLGTGLVCGKTNTIKVFASPWRNPGPDSNSILRGGEPKAGVDVVHTSDLGSRQLAVSGVQHTSAQFGSPLLPNGTATTGPQSGPFASGRNRQVPATQNRSNTSSSAQAGASQSNLPISDVYNGQRFENIPPSPAPQKILTTLTSVWSSGVIKGSVVMHNTVVQIFTKTFIGLLFGYFASDTKQAITAVGAELKCHLKYKVVFTGDLLLWTEPHDPEDESSFNRGHMFLGGWISRTASFGFVKPSEHWAAIREPMAPLYISSIQSGVRVNNNSGSATNSIESETEANKRCIIPNDSASDSFRRVADTIQNPLDPELGSRGKVVGGPAETSSSSEDPKIQWRKYMAKFRLSDFDLLMVEETAKSEGELRMVLDKETGQIVSVQELVLRTIYRCSSDSKRGAAPSPFGTSSKKQEVAEDRGNAEEHGGGGEVSGAPNKKRKAGDGSLMGSEDSRGEKRARI